MTSTPSIPFGPEAKALLEKSPPEQLRLLIEYLGTQSQAKIALATHVLTGGGPPIVSMLIHEAFAKGRRPTHAVRLLAIVGRIGGPINFDDWMLLSAARIARSKLIRGKCEQLLAQLGHAVV
jgi:hypothetical protein